MTAVSEDRWPVHYTASRPAWWRRSIVWRHMPLRRLPENRELFEWEVKPTMRFWRHSRAVDIAVAFTRASLRRSA